jgi:hypothetical protein
LAALSIWTSASRRFSSALGIGFMTHLRFCKSNNALSETSFLSAGPDGRAHDFRARCLRIVSIAQAALFEAGEPRASA